MDKKQSEEIPLEIDGEKLAETRHRYRQFATFFADNKYSINEGLAFLMQMSFNLGTDVKTTRKVFKLMIDELSNHAEAADTRGVSVVKGKEESTSAIMAINGTVQ